MPIFMSSLMTVNFSLWLACERRPTVHYRSNHVKFQILFSTFNDRFLDKQVSWDKITRLASIWCKSHDLLEGFLSRIC